MKSALKVLVFLIMAMPALGQITLPGKDTRDKFLTPFWSQNGNADSAINGINANGTAKINSARLADTLDSKSYKGILDGTNNAAQRFVLRTWDTNMVSVGVGGLQLFELTLNTNLPVSTNLVSRVGFPEWLQNKDLDQWRLISNGVFQTGVPVAQGSTRGKVVAGLSGTNRVYIQKAWSTATPTTYLEFKEGILTAVP